MLEKARWYLEKTRWHLRKTVFRTYRYLKHPRRLKASPSMRWFARHFLDKHVWRPTQSTFAGGAALGFFITIQWIPGQLPIGVLLAALLRVNIPTVIVLCLASNPFTFLPIASVENIVGNWLMPYLGETLSDFIEQGTQSFLAFLRQLEAVLPEWLMTFMSEKGARWLASMYVGGFVGGLLSIPIVYALAWFSWKGVARLLRIPLHRRAHRLDRERVAPSPAPASAGEGEAEKEEDPPVK